MLGEERFENNPGKPSVEPIRNFLLETLPCHTVIATEFCDDKHTDSRNTRLVSDEDFLRRSQRAV